MALINRYVCAGAGADAGACAFAGDWVVLAGAGVARVSECCALFCSFFFLVRVE